MEDHGFGEGEDLEKKQEEFHKKFVFQLTDEEELRKFSEALAKSVDIRQVLKHPENTSIYRTFVRNLVFRGVARATHSIVSLSAAS